MRHGYQTGHGQVHSGPRKGPEGFRPNRFIGTEANPILATRANLRRNWYLTKKAIARGKRPTKVENGRTFVLHETKGWQSARIAA